MAHDESFFEQFLRERAAEQAEHSYVSSETRRRVNVVRKELQMELDGREPQDLALADRIVALLDDEELTDIVADWLGTVDVFFTE